MYFFLLHKQEVIMEKRRKKALGILGSTAACMIVMAVPAYAQEQEQGSSETNENPADSVLAASAWENRAAANVENYAYILSLIHISYQYEVARALSANYDR